MAKKQASALPEAEFYFLSHDLSRKAIGKYPPTKFVPSGLNASFYERPRSMTKLRHDVFPEFEPELIWELEDKAKLTDLIYPGNITAKGLLISQRLKEVLEDYKLMNHRFYKAAIIHKSQKYDYWWLYFLINEKEYDDEIDFTKSTFYFNIDQEAVFQASNIQQIINKSEKINLNIFDVLAKILILRNVYDIKKFWFFVRDPIITNKLAKQLYLKDFSGIQLDPAYQIGS